MPCEDGTLAENPNDNSRPGAEYDPYDPDHKGGGQRRLVRPRLVDLSKPLPPPDPGAAVPRPYQAQKRIRDESVVPPEDNPLSGWRWLGARMLSRNLWPRNVLTNPVMVYYSGRRAGRVWEDLLGLAPWLFFLLADGILLSEFGKTISAIWGIGIGGFWILSFFSLIYSSVMVGYHIRRSSSNLPLEEMLLTRLRHVDIVQGLSIRPLAIQMAGIFFFTIGHILLVLAAAIKFGHPIESPPVVGYILTIGLFHWYFLGVLAETGGAIGTRAHFCLRSPLTATLRVMLDLTLVAIPVLILAGLSGFCAGGFVASGPASMVLLVLALVLFALPLGEMLFRNMAVEAMDWTHHYPDEWWIANPPENAEVANRERTLLTPWKPIPGRRKIIIARAMKSEPRNQ